MDDIEDEVYGALGEIYFLIDELYESIRSSNKRLIKENIKELKYGRSQFERVLKIISADKENMPTELHDKIHYANVQINKVLQEANKKYHSIVYGEPMKPYNYRFGNKRNKRNKKKDTLSKLKNDLKKLR